MKFSDFVLALSGISLVIIAVAMLVVALHGNCSLENF